MTTNYDSLISDNEEDKTQFDFSKLDEVVIPAPPNTVTKAFTMLFPEINLESFKAEHGFVKGAGPKTEQLYKNHDKWKRAEEFYAHPTEIEKSIEEIKVKYPGLVEYRAALKEAAKIKRLESKKRNKHDDSKKNQVVTVHTDASLLVSNLERNVRCILDAAAVEIIRKLDTVHEAVNHQNKLYVMRNRQDMERQAVEKPNGNKRAKVSQTDEDDEEL